MTLLKWLLALGLSGIVCGCFLPQVYDSTQHTMIMVQASVVRRETIGVQGNRYDTFEIVPDMERLESQHVVKKSDRPGLTVWFTADDKKIPVRIQSKARVGYFIFELVTAS